MVEPGWRRVQVFVSRIHVRQRSAQRNAQKTFWGTSAELSVKWVGLFSFALLSSFKHSQMDCAEHPEKIQSSEMDCAEYPWDKSQWVVQNALRQLSALRWIVQSACGKLSFLRAHRFSPFGWNLAQKKGSGQMLDVILTLLKHQSFASDSCLEVLGQCFIRVGYRRARALKGLQALHQDDPPHGSKSFRRTRFELLAHPITQKPSLFFVFVT